MAKLKYLALAGLIIAATLFDFVGNGNTVETLDQTSEITINVSGELSATYHFDHSPTIGEVLDQAGLANDYNFNLGVVLNNNHNLYLSSGPELISLNNATSEQLDSIKGIGPVTAQKIIEYRNNQPFETIEQIMEISGIGEKTYLKLREFLCL